MKTVAAIAMFVALVALAVMSLAPPDLVGARSGLGSLAGLVTAAALAVVALVGGWIWLRDGRMKK